MLPLVAAFATGLAAPLATAAVEWPFPKPEPASARALRGNWFGKVVYPRKYSREIRFGDWIDGEQQTWVPHNLMNAVVREDRGGFVRVFDGRREGWIHRLDMVLLADAPAWWDAVLRERPADSHGWFMRGSACHDLERYDDAISDFNESIRLDPCGAAYIGRGQCWRRKGEYDTAIADYTEAIRLDPKDPIALLNRGNAYRWKDDRAAALADYDAALELDPNRVSALIGRGLVRTAQKEYEKALADLDAAIKVDPGDGEARTYRARTLVRMGKRREAMTAFEEALARQPTAWVYNAVAWFRATAPDADVRDGKAAIALAEKAIAANKAEWNYVDTLAAAHAEAGDFARAVEVQQKAMAMLKERKAAAEKDIKEAEQRLELYRAKKPFRDP